MKIFPERSAYLECADYKDFFLLAALWMRQQLGEN